MHCFRVLCRFIISLLPLKLKAPQNTPIYIHRLSLIGLWWAYENSIRVQWPGQLIIYVGLRDWSCQHDLVTTIYLPTHLNPRLLLIRLCLWVLFRRDKRRKFFISIFLIISYIYLPTYLTHISFFPLLFLSFRNLNSTDESPKFICWFFLICVCEFCFGGEYSSEGN